MKLDVKTRHTKFRGRQGPPRNRRRAQRRRMMLIEQYGPVCHYCGKTTNRITLDHKRPRSAFHKDSGARFDHPDNLVLACRPCNVKKGNIRYWEFIKSLGKTP